MDRIAELRAILADKKKLLGVIRTEILLIADKYGDDRRTSIGFDEYDISMEDLIPVTNTVITMTKLGYIKRMSLTISAHRTVVVRESREWRRSMTITSKNFLMTTSHTT